MEQLYNAYTKIVVANLRILISLCFGNNIFNLGCNITSKSINLQRSQEKKIQKKNSKMELRVEKSTWVPVYTLGGRKNLILLNYALACICLLGNHKEKGIKGYQYGITNFLLVFYNLWAIKQNSIMHKNEI